MVLCTERMPRAPAGLPARLTAGNRFIGWLLAVCVFLAPPVLRATPIDAGVAWLTQQSQNDGSFSGNSEIATPFQATAGCSD